MNALPRPLLVFGALASLAVPAFATVSVVSNFHLGEADPGAVAGGQLNSTTLDSAGGNNLPFIGTAGAGLYSSSVGVSGSSLSADFSPSSGFAINSPIITATDNWGIEAWVQSDDFSTVSAIVYNGNSANAGMGIYQFGGNYIGLVGGLAFVGSAPITANWTHLAMVVSGGATTFYANGANAGTGPAPNPASGYFEIGTRPDLGEQFDGRVDEVRVFTFNPGEFNPATDLQLTSVVPEPGSAALLAPGLTVVGFRRRR